MYLQKRGWRTGLLGWTLGGYLAGAWSRGTDVTPQRSTKWSEDDSLPEVRKRKLKRELSAPAGLEYLETLVVHIPSSAPDGYYRLVSPSLGTMKDALTRRQTICNSPTHRPIIGSTSFRLYSSSLSTPSPRGANVYQLPAELVLGILAGALGTLLVAAFSVLFPFAKLASLLPGKWGKYLLRWVWGLIGGEDVERKVREHRTVKGATERVDRLDRSIAWSRIGVRRKRDAREDEGGGVALRM